MERVDHLLIPIIRDLGISDIVKLSKIKKNWHTIFLEPLSCHMSPCKVSKGEILLTVDSPIWLQELHYLKEDIVKKLSFYGITEVRFKLGRVPQKIKSEVSKSNYTLKHKSINSGESKMGLLTMEEQAYLEETVSKINDLELREKIRNAIEKSIIARKISNSKH